MICSQWQDKDFEYGELWSLEKLEEKHTEVSINGVNMTAREKHGVSEVPMFNIEIDHYVPPIFTTLLE